jgi:5-methylcytosine-specific restriction endonuclease McrBC regulatory subunit McrC
MSQTINYCSPAFHEVDGNIDTNKIKSIKNNSFYKEYEEGLYVANLILKRFGYNIKGIENLKSRIIKVPPFWVDMPKLFELYVLGLLKEKYSNQIKFQVQGVYGKPDFILSDSNNKMIIDAKYKPYYCNSFAALDQWKRDMVISDIRQLSGYSRDKKILSKLGLTTPEEQEKAIDCLIIYPDQSGTERLKGNLKGSRIDGFINFYKMGVKLPVIEDNLHESEEKKIKQTAD